MTEILPCVEIEPSSPARASIIWLHGLGADGHDFAGIAPMLDLPAALAPRFVFPHAPPRRITLNAGMRMRAWYDIGSLDFSRAEDGAGIRESEARIRALIEREHARGIAHTSIVLAGFSQGGAIALHTGLRYPQRLAGIMALSTYLPLASTVKNEAHIANHDIPIFMAHGAQDPVVAPIHGEISRRTLEKQGYPVEWHGYAMPHSVCDQELRDIAGWLRRVLDLARE